MIRKNIVFITTSLGTGGAQKVMCKVANFCVQQGYQVSIVSIKNDETLVDISPEIEVYNLGIKRVGGLNNALILLRNIKLHYILKKIKPDEVVMFTALTSLYCYLGVKWNAKKLVCAERDNPKAMSKFTFFCLQYVYKKVDKVIFQMKGARDCFCSEVIEKSYIIPNACSLTDPDLQYDSANTNKIILSAGRLEKVKRFDLLLEAFARACERNRDYKLVIFGDGQLKQELKMLSIKLNIEDNVLFKGNIKDFWHNIELPRCFVLASDSEGIPNVILEAMHYGIPCISTDCEPGGSKMLLEGGVIGRLVERNNVAQLAEAICLLMNDDEKCNEYSKNGLNAIKKYDPDDNLLEWMRVLEEVDS